MQYRNTEIYPAKDPGDAGTEIININLKDPISRLTILYKLTTDAGAMSAALCANISKIELVDGSDVLHSLSGYENQALCIYDRRVPTMNDGQLVAGAVTMASFGIDFGRYLYDPELAFDPTRFRNPQLKITYNISTCDASATIHTFEVSADVFDEKIISPMGFLMSKSIVSWVPSANDEYETIEIPTDYPIRQMLLRNYKAQDDPRRNVDHIRLSEDNLKRVVFDYELDAYLGKMRGTWLPLIEMVNEYADGEGTYYKYCTPTSWDTVYFGTSRAQNDIVWITGSPAGGYIQRRGLTSGFVNGALIGYLPHHCWQFPLGNQQDLNDWYDVTKKGSVEVRLQAAAQYASSIISLVLQQLRRY